MTKDEQIELLQLKDEEIDGMKNELLREQQVNSHVHMIQEKEILEKERAITFLNKQLTVKQKENDCLRKLNKKVVFERSFIELNLYFENYKQQKKTIIIKYYFQGNSRERSVTVSPNGEDTETIEQNMESEIEDDFIFVEDLKADEEKGDNISLG